MGYRSDWRAPLMKAAPQNKPMTEKYALRGTENWRNYLKIHSWRTATELKTETNAILFFYVNARRPRKQHARNRHNTCSICDLKSSKLRFNAICVLLCLLGLRLSFVSRRIAWFFLLVVSEIERQLCVRHHCWSLLSARPRSVIARGKWRLRYCWRLKCFFPLKSVKAPSWDKCICVPHSFQSQVTVMSIALYTTQYQIWFTVIITIILKNNNPFSTVSEPPNQE